MDKKIIDDAIASYNVSDAYLHQIVNDYQNFTILDYSNKEEIEGAKKKGREIAKIRTSIDAKRKELKAIALEYGRAVDGEAARLVNIISPIEMKFKAEIEKAEKWEQEQERIRRQKIVDFYKENGFSEFNGKLFSGDFFVDIDESFYSLKPQMHQMLIEQGVKSKKEREEREAEEERQLQIKLKLERELREKEQELKNKEAELARKTKELEDKMKAMEEAQQKQVEVKVEVEQPKVEEIKERKIGTLAYIGITMGKNFKTFSEVLDCELYVSTCYDSDNKPHWVVSSKSKPHNYSINQEIDSDTMILDAQNRGWLEAVEEYESTFLFYKKREDSLDSSDDN